MVGGVHNKQERKTTIMKRIGKTPVFGIDKAEPGIFVSQVEYNPSCETYEQLDHTGEVQGIALYKQRVEVTLTGEVPHEEGGSGTPSFTLGGTITLANECPASSWLGGEAPTATTTVITALPHTRQREGAQEINVTATIYPFSTAG